MENIPKFIANPDLRLLDQVFQVLDTIIIHAGLSKYYVTGIYLSQNSMGSKAPRHGIGPGDTD